MTPKKFEYLRPESLEQAVEFLNENSESKVLAGGQSLIALMKLRLAEPKYLVDIGRIRDLSYIKMADGGKIAIGALTTHEQVEESDLLRQYCPILPQMARQIGDPQIRTRGTIGGSVAHADPSGDPPTVVLALDAELKVIGPNSERIIPAAKFFKGAFSTALEPNEILTEVRVPTLGPEWSTVYQKYAWREGDFAIVGFAGAIKLEGRTVRGARFSFASMGDTPIRAIHLEREILNKTLSENTIKEMSELSLEATSPASDVHVSAEFRKNAAKNIVRRFLAESVAKVEGGR